MRNMIWETIKFKCERNPLICSKRLHKHVIQAHTSAQEALPAAERVWSSRLKKIKTKPKATILTLDYK